MAETTGNLRCTLTCWGAGLVIGALGAVLVVVIGGYAWTGAIFMGAVVFLLAGLLMSVLFCRPLPTLADVQARHAAAARDLAGATQGRPQAMVSDTAPAATAPLTRAPVAVEPMPDEAQQMPQDGAAAPQDRPDHSEPDAQAKPNAQAKPVSTPAPPVAHGTSAMPRAAVSAPAPPAMLDAPRGAGPDNLRLLRGVGPKLEATLHRMGVFHFAQIAAWTPSELAWIDQNLDGFKGRPSRDDWVGQASKLAGETAQGMREDDA